MVPAKEKGICYLCAAETNARFERGPEDTMAVCMRCVTVQLGYEKGQAGEDCIELRRSKEDPNKPETYDIKVRPRSYGGGPHGMTR